MPVEDRADVGSFWSGYTKEGPDLKRPRQLGNQAGELDILIHTDSLLYTYCAVKIQPPSLFCFSGFMATRSQIQYFHNTACPGGFLPPFDSKHWRGDSLQHGVEFWSGGLQLFGQCSLNR